MKNATRKHADDTYSRNFRMLLNLGNYFTVVKDVSQSIDPFLLSGLRNLIATLVLFAYFISTKKWKNLLDKDSLKSGLVLGILLGAIYISQTIGIIFTSANHSAFITCSAVIMVPVILFLFGWEKFNRKQTYLF